MTIDLWWVLYSASCFFFYAIGRQSGIRYGFKIGQHSKDKEDK